MRLQPRRPSDKGKEREIDEAEMDNDMERMRIVQFVLMVDVQGAGMLPNIVSLLQKPPSSLANLLGRVRRSLLGSTTICLPTTLAFVLPVRLPLGRKDYLIEICLSVHRKLFMGI